MDEEEKMLWMFEQVHGKEHKGSACYTEVQLVDEWNLSKIHESSVHLMKDGNICWSKTKTELIFDFLTKDL